MSSEYSIHLYDDPLEGRIQPLSPTFATTIVRVTTKGAEIVLFIPNDRLLEMSLLFHKIAQDLAALLPDVDACCRCVPGTPDDQCAEHGYGAFKINKAGGDGTSTCALCGWPCDGGPRVVHSECAAREQYEADRIPIDDAREAVEPPHRWG